MPDRFESLKIIFETEPGLKVIRNIVKSGDVIAEFYKIFPELKKVVKPVRVDKRILVLISENSVMRSELKFKEKLVIDKINGYFKENRIKGIRFISR
jgi:Dna[CI] antecedent, DciA